MKRNVISVGLAVVFCAGALVASKQVSLAQPDAWFVQDFEGIEPGRYKVLDYTADGVDVKLSGVTGLFFIEENDLGGQFGNHSLTGGRGKGSSVLMEFSEAIQGIDVSLMSECSRPSIAATVACYDAAGELAFFLSNWGRPCNQFTRTAASIIGESVVWSCVLTGGIVDNMSFVVNHD